MRVLVVSSVICLLLLPATSFAQDQDLEGWELPERLKGSLDKKCPEGTWPDEKGWCTRKQPPPDAPKTPPASPTPAAKPAPKPAPAEKPAPAAKPAGATRPPVRPPVAPAPAAPEPKAKEAAPIGEPEKKTAAGTEEREEKTDEQEKPAEASPVKRHSQSSFVKGELASFIGVTKLVTKNNRVGVRLGYRALDLVHYATINPEADFRIWKFEVGLGVPLAFEIFDGNWDDDKEEPVGFDNAGDIRKEDWDEAGEYVRFIRYLRFGKKEDNVFFDLSQHASTTIGHGPLMRRYSVNIDPDSTRLSAELDMYNDYAGFEFVTNSVVDWDIFGGIGFVKPLSFFMDHPVARSLSIGLTYLADRHAPVTLATQDDPDNPYWVTGTGRPRVASDAFLHAMGVDIEIKVLKTDTVDLKPFVDYSWMMPGTPSGDDPEDVSGGGGLTIGLLGRFNLGRDPVHAFRIIGEFRSFSSDYLPGYFDTFYEIQRFVSCQRYARHAQAHGGLPPTKFYEMFVERTGGDRHLGFYLEFNYAVVDYLVLTLGLEGSDADCGNNFLAHVEVPALDWLQFFFSFHQRAMADLGDLFSGDSSDKILFAAARLGALPFLFFNFRYHHTFELKDGYRDLDGDGLEQQYRYYLPTHGWMADFELGWEF